MITLVGVGHVFDLRSQLHEVIRQRRPRVVGLELDDVRWAALQTRDHRGGAPIVYRLLSFFQERIADKYGGRVGEEMIAAADAAKAVGADLAFIDRDSGDTFRAMWGGMGPGERLKFLLSLVGGMFVTKRRVESELQKFEQDSAGYLEQAGEEFPNLKRVLLDDRNEYMARAIRDLHARRGAVVAVVGDGHVDGLRAALADLPVEVIRLRDLRQGSLPPPPTTPPAGSSVTFSYDVRGPGTT
ncbi:MAG TPA: TraB/GumN family protein [Thermoplasmata archaeon]|jgi:pheromone shutdown protein TraB|nr:TraB/GumN family protein [Thermoplasmata archaeon]